MNPDAAAMPLETPISVPENCGAMSMWLTKNPHKLTPDIVVESVISVTASAVWVQLRKLTPIKNNAPPNAPTKVKSFLVVVVDRNFRDLR